METQCQKLCHLVSAGVQLHICRVKTIELEVGEGTAKSRRVTVAVKSSKSENVLKFPICGKSTTYGDFLLACYRLARLHKSNKDGNIRHFVVMSKILC